MTSAAANFQTHLAFRYDDAIAARDALMNLVGRAHERAYDALAIAAQVCVAPDATAQAAVEALFQSPIPAAYRARHAAERRKL